MLESEYCTSATGTASIPITANYTKLGSSGLPEWNESDDGIRCYYLDYEGDVVLTIDGGEYENPIIYCPLRNSTAKFEPTSTDIYYTPLFKLSEELYAFENIYVYPQGFSQTFPKEATNAFTNGSTGSFGDYSSLIIFPQPEAVFNVPCSGALAGDIDDLVEKALRPFYGSALYVTGSQLNEYTIQVINTTSSRESEDFKYMIRRGIAFILAHVDWGALGRAGATVTAAFVISWINGTSNPTNKPDPKGCC